MYYIGYNENFANYRAEDRVPEDAQSFDTARLRIGLAHGLRKRKIASGKM